VGQNFYNYKWESQTYYHSTASEMVAQRQNFYIPYCLSGKIKTSTKPKPTKSF